jgi:N6-L-threonylcarbamoyladenine synthase
MKDSEIFLALESSCDDTSLAVFQWTKLLALRTHTQLIEHQETRWVVPESAARLHADNIFPLLREVLQDAGITLDQLNYIACTFEPWLVPSLLVTKSVAKVLSLRLGIPLLPVHHIEGHLFALLLGRYVEDMNFPILVMTVSWGHNEIYLWKNLHCFERVAFTRDDSAGEAFDKVSKMLGLPFPGGPHIARYAQIYKENPWTSLLPSFPLPKFHFQDGLGEFSFSWLKSAVKREIDIRMSNNGGLTESDRCEIAYAFQEIVTQYLSESLYRLAESYPEVQSLGLCGGVSANDRLREVIIWDQRSLKYKQFIVPLEKRFSLDNAAMIGMRAYYSWGS